MWCAAVSAASLNKPLASQAGGTCAHAAARGGRAGALYLLHYAGAQLQRQDHNMRTPLAVAVLGQYCTIL